MPAAIAALSEQRQRGVEHGIGQPDAQVVQAHGEVGQVRGGLGGGQPPVDPGRLPGRVQRRPPVPDRGQPDAEVVQAVSALCGRCAGGESVTDGARQGVFWSDVRR
jgi:hypothetical protein